MMKVYTNGAYAAALHRVVLPSPAKRLSAAFFTFPNMDATIAPLPAMITKDRTQQYVRGDDTTAVHQQKV